MDAATETGKRIARTEAYAEKVRRLFASTVNEILAMNKTIPTLEEGVMFSFDGQSVKKQKEVEELLRRLHSLATLSIEKGMELEWEKANDECDKLLSSIFGKGVLETPQFAAWLDRNTNAMRAFIERSDTGLNLSDRVWRSVRQLRDEMEIAMTVAIGEGDSASSISRKVRQYLNDPDLMFRRFRYKAGEEVIFDDEGNEIGRKPIYGKKWKKRIKDEATGKYRWIDYDRDSYKTGSGVYKSSAKNAMRVARTETNMAYRRADNERWKRMDFVLGQRIQLSNSHPMKDICDTLAGDYPKEFVFEGWHPQCFCFVTPILMDEDEMAKMSDAFLEGKEYKPKGKPVKDYPDAFKRWVKDNSEKIVDAHDYMRDPYFVRHNWAIVNNILHPMSVQERARIRHEARTKAQIDDIKARVAERQALSKAKVVAGNVLNAYAKKSGYSTIDKSGLENAIINGTSFDVKNETVKLAKEMAAYNKQVKKANNIKNAFVNGHYDLLGLDSDLLELVEVVNKGSKEDIKVAVAKLAKTMSKAKHQAMLEYAENPTLWGLINEFGESLAKSFMDNWNKHLSKSCIYTTDELFLEKVIKKELYYANLNPDKYPTTKKFIYFFEKKKVIYENRIKLNALQQDIGDISAFASTCKANAKIHGMVDEIMKLTIDIDHLDIATINAKIADAKKEVDRLTKERLKRKKSNIGSYDIERFYSKDELNKLSKLRYEYEKAIHAAGGDERDTDVVNSMRNLADYISVLGERYVGVQPTLSNVDGLTEAEVKKAIEEYFNHTPVNPVCPSEPWGIWSNSHGGLNWWGMSSECKQLASFIKKAGGNVTAEELSTITDFTHSSNWICDFLYGASKVKDITDDNIRKDIERMLANFKATINHAIENMPRYNGITYRGLNIYPQAITDPSKDTFWNSIMNAWNSPDKIWSMVAPTSTTTSIHVADNFANGVVHKSKGQRVIMKIHGKTGVDIHKIGYFGGGESEITFRAGSKFRLLKEPYQCKTNGVGKIGDWCVEIEEII